jgi:hypothetical protein
MAEKLNIKAAFFRTRNCSLKGHKTVRNAALFSATEDGK